MTSLDLSGNIITSFETLALLLQWSPNITKLNIANTGLTTVDLKDLLKEIPTIEWLNISDNNLGDSGLLILEDALKSKKQLKTLLMDRTLEKRTSARIKAMEALGGFLNSNECAITTFSIVGGQKSSLKGDLVPFVISLMANDTLTSLDISSNAGGNTLALATSKMLQNNNTLKYLALDDNGITLLGFQALRQALLQNNTLQCLAQPTLDVSATLTKEDKNSILEVLRDIERVTKIQ